MKKTLPLTALAALALTAPAPDAAAATAAGAKRAIIKHVRKAYANRSENGVRVSKCRRLSSRRYRCTFEMIDGPRFAVRAGRATATRRSGRWSVRTSAVKRTH